METPRLATERTHSDSEAGGATLVAETETLVVPLESHSQDRGLRRALVGLATVDGYERWRTDGIQTAPVSDESTVYGAEIGDSGGSSAVFALSAVDGNERWRFTRSCEGFSRVVVSGGTAYVASRYGDSTLYALASET